MSILISSAQLEGRRAIVRSALAPLAASLADDLRLVAERDLYFPREKALLSRDGGRCARDGSYLDFDPFRPHEHRCLRCGEVYRGDHHDRFWIYWYQMWLAERAVHAAALAATGADDRFVSLAEDILSGYVDRYASYPNVDNVLGPSRLFFSTYLESIWLLQICIATDLIADRNPGLQSRVRDRIVEPARAIIREYDEAGSNRQVWNDAALLAAARSLGDRSAAELAVFGNSGVASQLSNGLLPDGTWYEGENYHLFAHRGLWYGVTMAGQAGLEIPEALLRRFDAGFATPFATALPDFTLPSRRDSQYAISLRQWRIAEHCELGIARRDDSVLAGALARMYDPSIRRSATGRDRSSADIERNAEPSGLTRADLSWRALLFARATLPEQTASVEPARLLDAQGIAVFRRDGGRAYVALDYGHSGGGHGHPDRLNLLLAVGDRRWLDDFGTGSYVDRSLHWYRSSLAHNAPMFGGRSQLRVNGQLLAFDEKDGAGWIAASANNLAPATSAARTVVVMADYAIDLVEWVGERETLVDLPLHCDIEFAEAAPLRTAKLAGGDGLEDGFSFLHDSTVQSAPALVPLRGVAGSADIRLDVFVSSSVDAEWWRATAPGPPARGDHVFRIVRARSAEGVHRIVWSWSGAVVAVDWQDDAIVVTMADGTTHTHQRTETGWRATVGSSGDQRVIELDGIVEEPVPVEPMAPRSSAKPLVLAAGKPLSIELGEAHYRRSEQNWRDAGAPRADVELQWTGEDLIASVDVRPSERTFVPADAENPYDNEPADINGDGIQFYLRTTEGFVGWLLVPESGSGSVRARLIEGSTNRAPAVTWEATDQGYRIVARFSGVRPSAVDIVVNEMPRGRARRRGQLVLSGARGEFVYLRGDRHDDTRLIPLSLTDV